MTSQPTPNHAATGDPGPARSRRSFLGRALGASALALPALGLVSTPRGGRGPKKVGGPTATLLQEIMNDEAAHVKVIQNLLDDDGQPPAGPDPAGPEARHRRA